MKKLYAGAILISLMTTVGYITAAYAAPTIVITPVSDVYGGDDTGWKSDTCAKADRAAKARGGFCELDPESVFPIGPGIDITADCVCVYPGTKSNDKKQSKKPTDN